MAQELYSIASNNLQGKESEKAHINTLLYTLNHFAVHLKLTHGKLYFIFLSYAYFKVQFIDPLRKSFCKYLIQSKQYHSVSLALWNTKEEYRLYVYVSKIFFLINTFTIFDRFSSIWCLGISVLSKFYRLCPTSFVFNILGASTALLIKHSFSPFLFTGNPQYNAFRYRNF